MQFLIFVCNFKGILNRLDWLCRISSFVSVVVVYVRFQIELSIPNQAVYLIWITHTNYIVMCIIYRVNNMLVIKGRQGFSNIWNFKDRCCPSSHWPISVFRLLTDFVCLYNYEFWLFLYKIVRSSVILLLPLLNNLVYYLSCK